MLTPDTSAHKISRMIVVTGLIILSMITTAMLTLDLNVIDDERISIQSFATTSQTSLRDNSKADITSPASTNSLISGLGLNVNQQPQD